MKLQHLFEHSDRQLIDLAKKIGQQMYGSSHSGLVFRDQVKTMQYSKYVGDQEEPTVDTYDYVFFPSSGKGLDAADQEFTKDMVDTDGKIYIAGSNGVVILTNPFEKSSDDLDTDYLDEFEKFKKEVLKHYPNATFSKTGNTGFQADLPNQKMVAQFAFKNGFNNKMDANKPAWLISKLKPDNTIDWENTLAKSNWS